jgi:hypothetical protein
MQILGATIQSDRVRRLRCVLPACRFRTTAEIKLSKLQLNAPILSRGVVRHSGCFRKLSDKKAFKLLALFEFGNKP